MDVVADAKRIMDALSGQSDLSAGPRMAALALANCIAEIERLRGAIAAIQEATLNGQICDDVAWFDQITTLHDFCEMTLNPPNI